MEIRFPVAVLVALAGCKDTPRDQAQPPIVPAEKAVAPTPTPAPPAGPVMEPLHPIRAEAAAGNRKALDTMASSIGCAGGKPSEPFAPYCAAARDFPSGSAAALPAETTVLLGTATFIEPGPPSVATLGTPVPVLFKMQRTGQTISVKQTVLRAPAGDDNALPVLVGRIKNFNNGIYDHVDVPASLAAQIVAAEQADAVDILEASGDSYWVQDLDGFELRRAHDRWIGMGAGEGPDGRHILVMLVDKMKVLGPKETSPQKIQVLHLK